MRRCGWGRWAALGPMGVLLVGCVTPPVDSESSSDVVAYRTILEEPVWLAHMSRAEIRALVDEVLETPIEFHGRVVDEKGDPVENAEIRFKVFDHPLDPFEFPYIGWTERNAVKSDRDGRFELTGVTGSAIYMRVYKPGWKSVGNSKRHIRYASFWQYRNDHPIPSSEAPTVFVMTPGSPLEDHVVVETGALRLPVDGREIEVQLDEVNPYGVDPGRGDLAIACAKGPVERTGHWDWSCRVRMPPGGGVQYRHDLTVQQAPAEGYQSVLEFGMDAENPQWVHRAERYLYVKLAQGPRYGHLTLKVRTASQLYVDLDGMLNVTGSRQLETRYPSDD